MADVVKFVVLCAALAALAFGVTVDGRHYQVACNQAQGIYLSH